MFIIKSSFIRSFIFMFILGKELQDFPKIAWPMHKDGTLNIGALILEAWKAIKWNEDQYMGKNSSKNVRVSGIGRFERFPSDAVYHSLIFAVLKNSLPHGYELSTNVDFEYDKSKKKIYFYKNN